MSLDSIPYHTQHTIFALNNQGAYPSTPAQMCSFITEYMQEQLGSGVTCNPVFGSGTCVHVDGNRIHNFCFHDMATSSHAYIGPLDEISIQLGHWCNTNPSLSGEPASHPVTSQSGGVGGHRTKQYVIWTRLEPSGIGCVDNYPD